jgi:DNA mismatch endonuclease (patch repair protein)
MANSKKETKKRTDIYSKKKRSKIMGSIKGRDNLLELKFEKILKDAGLKFKRNAEELPGKPDVVFKNKKIIIFVDGCFWHGCKKHFSLPKSNQWFWKNKIEGNINRDKSINKFYKNMGWRILRIWQHDMTRKSNKIAKILSVIKIKNNKK